jgi:hypothetical protein
MKMTNVPTSEKTSGQHLSWDPGPHWQSACCPVQTSCWPLGLPSTMCGVSRKEAQRGHSSRLHGKPSLKPRWFPEKTRERERQSLLSNLGGTEGGRVASFRDDYHSRTRWLEKAGSFFL